MLFQNLYVQFTIIKAFQYEQNTLKDFLLSNEQKKNKVGRADIDKNSTVEAHRVNHYETEWYVVCIYNTNKFKILHPFPRVA